MRGGPLLGLAVIAAALAGCAAASRTPMTVTERETLAACRAHADQVYDRLNRGAIYSIPQTGLPSSSTGLMGDPNAGLRAEYRREQMIDRCVRQTGAGPDTVAPARPPGPSPSPVR